MAASGLKRAVADADARLIVMLDSDFGPKLVAGSVVAPSRGGLALVQADALEWVTTTAGLVQLRADWACLPRLYDSPFLRHEWFSAWWGAFGTGQLAVLAARRHGRLVGVLPMARHGRRLSSLANRHTQLFSAIAVDAETRESLASTAVNSPDLRLAGLLGEDAFLSSVRAQADHARRISIVQTIQHSPFIEIEGSIDDYKHHVLSAGTRRSLARSLRQIERDHAPQFRLIEAPEDASAAIEEAFALELAGWKGRDGTAILSNASTAEFFREVALSFDTLGILRLSTMRVRGELVAFELSAIDGGRLWSMKTSFDERLAPYSPGRLLRLAVIERCFDLGLRTNEMLGSDDPYKRSFATGTREVCTVLSHDRTPISLARLGHRRYLRPTAKAVYLRSGGLTVRMAIRRARVRTSLT